MNGTRMTETRLLQAIALAAFMASAGLGIVQAASPADEKIQARQQEMKDNGKSMGALVKLFKGDSPYDPVAVKAAADAIANATAAARKAGAWDADSQKGSVETWAKPEIWTDTAGFSAAQQSLDDAVARIQSSSDEASFKAAFPALGEACKGCHEKFRRPKE